MNEVARVQRHEVDEPQRPASIFDVIQNAALRPERSSGAQHT